MGDGYTNGSAHDCNCNGDPAAVPIASSLAMGDGPPLLRRAVDQCVEELERCRSTLSRSANPATASRALVQSETGVSVDENPYHGIDRNRIEAVIRAAYQARAMPEVLLAKWAKEGSVRMTLSPTPVAGASTEANARTLQRSKIYYVELGVDWLTVTTRPDPNADNILDTTDSGAPAQETHFRNRVAELVRQRLLSENIASAVNTELAVTRSGSTYSVQPSVKFYGLSLILVDAVFARFLDMSFTELPIVGEELGYMLWNMGEASFRTFLQSADRHRRETQHLVNGQPISIEQWALHTRPRSNEWAQPRRNAIRFAHYIRSYRPIFRNAMALIKPGIEDLPRAGSLDAEVPAHDPFGLGPVGDVAASARPYEVQGVGGDTYAPAGALAVIGNGHGTFRHAPLDGGSGTGANVEARWNLERAPSDNRVDIVVHLHGYGQDARDFLATKARLAGVDLADASNNPRRASRPTLALVPRAHNTSGTTWLFDRLDATAEFTALVRASLDWLGATHLGLPAGQLQPARCIIHAHSGGGRGLSDLLRAGVDPDEVVCFDSTYGHEQPIIDWATRRLASARASASGLRVFYLPCSGGSSAHPGGQWRWDARRSRYQYDPPGSWTYRDGQWRLVGTEVSARRIQGALERALASHVQRAAMTSRFRVERTNVQHGEIPATYAPALLEDVARDVSTLGRRAPSAFAPPPMTTRPGCVSNDNWATPGAASVKPGGTAPPPPRPAAPPAGEQSFYEEDAAQTLAANLIRPIDIRGFRAVPITGQEFNGSSWVEVAWSSRALATGVGFSDLEAAGLAQAAGPDGFEIRIQGRLIVPPGLARRTEPVPLVVICMGNHQAFNGTPSAATEAKSFEGYDYMQQHLARAGYASLSVDTNPANHIDAGIRMRADLIWATIAQLQDHLGRSADLRGKIDFQNVAFVGHSRGGEAVVHAAKLNAHPLWRGANWAGRDAVRVRAIASIAPTDFSRGKSATLRMEGTPPVPGPMAVTASAPFALTVVDAERYLVIYGSHDGDVTGDAEPPLFFDPANRAGTGFSLYDRATINKTMVFGRGLTHNRFNTKWRECPNYVDFGHAFVHPFTCEPLPGERFDPFIFSAEAHRNLANFYVGALVDRVLGGDTSKEAILRGERAINADHAIAIQFQPLDRVAVHEFDSSAGLTPAGVTLVNAADIQHCPHDTRMFQGAGGSTVRMTVPASSRDIHTRAALSLRVGARYDVADNATIRRQAMPRFTVRLVTSTGDGRATQDHASRRGVLTPDRPYFHRAWFSFRDASGRTVATRSNASKLHLDTVVIPLTAFAAVDRTRPVTLSDVQAVELEIGSGGTDPVFIDSVAFI